MKAKIIERAYENIEKSINDFILNYNNEVVQKNNGEKIDISKEKIEEDLRKIFILFSKLRHSMVHYNYKFYQELYSGKDFAISDNIMLSELLDLNIFKELSKIKGIKNKAVSNYLDKNTNIYVLNKNVNAIKLLDIYRDICERKLGFNKFINDIITVSGEENKQYKEMVIKHFNREVNRLSEYLKGSKGNKRNLEKKMEEYKKIQEWFGGPYVYDIHSSKVYKDLYIERKDLVDEYSQIIEAGINNDNKKRLTEINEALFRLNKDMKKITKLNSKYRLQYKLQLAFGFILEEFNLDISKFMKDFNKDNDKDLTILDFIEKREIYLNKSLSRKDDRLEKIINDYKFRETEDIFYSDRDNNLVKLYILMYLLLPYEIRGDFLGFVKKNYYDMKHVDFIDKKDENNKETFFHDLRLFEKNIRKLQIIDYSLSSKLLDKEDMENIEKKLSDYIFKKVGIELPENMDIGQFNKSLILPLMKNYQIIFKLLNDIEISALFKIAEKGNNGKSITFKEAIAKVRKKDRNKNIKKDRNENINFSLVMKMALNKSASYKIRNNIAHINMEKLYIDPLNNYLDNTLNNKTISEQIEEIIDICIDEGVTGKELNNNIINDYYMKKERLVFNLKLRNQDDTVSIDKQKRLNDKKSILKKYRLNYKDVNLSEIIRKINNLEEEISSIKEDSKYNSDKKIKLSKDISLLNGILRQDIIFKVKKISLDMIQKNEYRYVSINIYDRINKEDYNIDLKVKDKLLVSTCYRDIYTNKKVNSVVEYSDDCKVVYISIHGKKYNIKLKFDDKMLIIEFDKDIKKSKQIVNLESKYIQNVKFIVS